MQATLATRVEDSKPPSLVRLAQVWHIGLALAAFSGAFLVGATESVVAWAATWRLLVALILAALGIANAMTVVFIQRRQHAGRTLSLSLNYLGFLISLLYGMHVLGVFLGIDSLAGTFKDGLIYLAGVFAGYLIGTIGDRYDDYPKRQQFFSRLSKVVMAVFGLLFLLAVGIIPGLLAIVRQLLNPLPFILFMLTVLNGLMVWAMWRQPAAHWMHAKNYHEEMLSGMLFLSPNLLGFLFFFAGPLLLSFSVSFTNWDAFGTRDWVGFSNYAKIFNLDFALLSQPKQPIAEVLDVKVYDELTRITLFGQTLLIGAQDKLFWIALRNTIVFSLLAVPLAVIPALLLATLLNSKLPGMKFFRGVYFLPSIAAVVGVALIWQWLYNAAVGYINFGISSSVEMLNGLFGLGIIDPQIRWLSDTRTALLAVVIMSAWQWIGFNTVLFLAGLQNIPGELYEAATVDGAGRWAKFWHVTIPLLAPTTFFVVTTAVISALQLFEQVYVLIPTEPPGGPNNATLSLVLYLYQKGFQRFEQGYASAVAWVLFGAIFTVTLMQYYRQRNSGAYGAG